ncbi:hypothetical protein MWU61_07205 [Loktanella sp. F6476L]|uniref:hypothetical protein n=1 Tax=Loktanella sp. F6476L TaxID=2926405 RepID=UPI001FF14217|nr:hypothetical protein [Loktanella sp. F6476L]MCK0120322.1 hypothetical protein [Loktanella sp. F6476L]
MTRLLTMLALVSVSLLSACAATPDSYVAGRADNDLLRFSAANYAIPSGPAR